MFLRIEDIIEIQMIGMHLQMSLTNDRSTSLWQSFMPRLKEINNRVGSELYSIEIYDANFFIDFNPANEFEKWAAVQVSDTSITPGEMNTLLIPKGRYAVFLHKGPASAAAKTYQYIFENWLPQSDYNLDGRPHFAVMGEKYKHDQFDSEEEIWIPVKVK